MWDVHKYFKPNNNFKQWGWFYQKVARGPEVGLRKCFTDRTSRLKVFCKKSLLRNLSKFTGKHLRPATLLKRRLWHRGFPVNSEKFLRTSFFYRAPPVAASVGNTLNVNNFAGKNSVTTSLLTILLSFPKYLL